MWERLFGALEVSRVERLGADVGHKIDLRLDLFKEDLKRGRHILGVVLEHGAG